MALNLSKGYTPSSGQVSNSSSYNTDIANLFNAFSGLEAQTSTLGALTVTPSANGATKFKVTDVAGNTVFAVTTSDTASSNAAIVGATYKFYLDGGGNTYLHESSADTIKIFTNGTERVQIDSSGITVAAGVYVDRGDPAVADNATGEFTKDDAWHNYDLSSIVPAGAKTILIRVLAATTAAGHQFALRKEGNSNAINMAQVRTQVANVVISQDLIVSCDANRVLEYFATNATWSTLNVTVAGWWR